jgi:hypothetical protein
LAAYWLSDWAAPLDTDITDQIIDAREFDPPADPANPAPSDRMLCDNTPAGSFNSHRRIEVRIAVTATAPPRTRRALVERVRLR